MLHVTLMSSCRSKWPRGYYTSLRLRPRMIASSGSSGRCDHLRPLAAQSSHARDAAHGLCLAAFDFGQFVDYGVEQLVTGLLVIAVLVRPRLFARGFRLKLGAARLVAL